MPTYRIVFAGGEEVKVPEALQEMVRLMISEKRTIPKFWELMEKLRPEEKEEWQLGDLQPKTPVTIMGGRYKSQIGSVLMICPASNHVVIQCYPAEDLNGGIVAVERRHVKEAITDSQPRAGEGPAGETESAIAHQPARDTIASTSSIKLESNEATVAPVPQDAGLSSEPNLVDRSNAGLKDGFPYGGSLAAKRRYVLEGAGISSSPLGISSSSSMTSSTALQFMTADCVRTCPVQFVTADCVCTCPWRRVVSQHRERVQRIKRMKLKETGAGATSSVNQA